MLVEWKKSYGKKRVSLGEQKLCVTQEGGKGEQLEIHRRVKRSKRVENRSPIELIADLQFGEVYRDT